MPPFRLGFKRSRSSSLVSGVKRRRVNVVPGGRRMVYARTRNYYGPYRTGGFYGSSVRSPREKKVVDVLDTTTAVNTTGSVTLLNGVATGTDFTDRIGRRTNTVAIQLRGIVQRDTTTGTQTADLLRILVIEDMQTNGVAPGIADIFNQAVGDAFINMNNRERFKVHMDEQLPMGPSLSTAGAVNPSPSTYNINFYKKCNIPTVYEGTAATSASISSGAVYLVTLGSRAAGNDDSIFRWSSRVRFVDA